MKIEETEMIRASKDRQVEHHDRQSIDNARHLKEEEDFYLFYLNSNLIYTYLFLV